MNRKLYLRDNDDGVFLCPVTQCLHSDFKSKRGFCRHIDTKHQWYFYFNTIPIVKKEVIMEQSKTISKSGVHFKKQPSFSVDVGVTARAKEK